MSRFGMQMPGGRVHRGASPDVYTALAVLATLALLTACVFVYVQGSKLSPKGDAISIQEPGRITLPQQNR